MIDTIKTKQDELRRHKCRRTKDGKRQLLGKHNGLKRGAFGQSQGQWTQKAAGII